MAKVFCFVLLLLLFSSFFFFSSEPVRLGLLTWQRTVFFFFFFCLFVRLKFFCEGVCFFLVLCVGWNWESGDWLCPPYGKGSKGFVVEKFVICSAVV